MVDTGNLQGGTIVVPGDVEYYTVPEPGMVGAVAVLIAVRLQSRRRRAC